MELAQYIRLFRKWAWLILLAAFLAGGVSFIVRTGQPSIYTAQTTIAIGRYIEAPNPNSSDIRTGIDLAQTYAELVATYDVLQGTIEVLDLPMTVDRLKEMIDVRTVSGTSLLVLSVKYTDPVLTADIANSLTQQLIANSPTNLTEDQQRQVDLLNAQIGALNTQLEETRLELAAVNQELAEATSSTARLRLVEQRNTLVDQINDAAATIAEFSSTIANLQQRTNAIDVVERARIPTVPSGTSSLNATLLGAMVGATLAGGLALLIEYLDDRVRTSDYAAQLLNLPILGSIVRFGKKRMTYPERLITNPDLPSSVAESYRSLRTNLLFSGDSERKKLYVVTSPGPIEGKSTTAANLAVSFAQAGLRVLLIDADLRRPRQHEIFGLDNSVGLTTLLFADPDKARTVVGPTGSSEQDKGTTDLKRCIQQTHVPNLRVITSGFIPANPAEVLGSSLMQRWMEGLRASPNLDIVLIDTPPALVVADSSVLAGSVKAGVVLVLDADKTRSIAALKIKEQFEQVGIQLTGVVLNRVNPRDEDYGYGYGYGYYYESAKATPPAHTNGHHKEKAIPGA